ncbi:MAG: porphobilinogen synthase [Chitinispirillaceae bacterium]|nr:porphobilinogen synthase [Chitinispirillaceae bacterium]
MGFPQIRLRRLRSNPALRSMVRETVLRPCDFIMPLFVCSGRAVETPIESMPGISRMSVDRCVEECRRIGKLGVNAVLLFGIPDTKDETGECGADDHGIVQQAVRAIKKALPDLLVITDVCNCGYTTHGHCGIVINGRIDNDRTLEVLALQAISHARAGCDMVAPSDMMDGRVGAIRRALDAAGFIDLPVMSYAAKYASAFYGPFREAADCAPRFGDRRTYQMDMTNSDEALREVALDLEEGADIVMVKPALAYLDIIHRVKTTFNVPVAAYNVSGEYAMVKAAAQKGWVRDDCIIMEILTSIKRAGASMIITYHAKEAASILREAYSR